MVKIALAGASSELAKEILDKLVATQKHEIIALDLKKFPSSPGVEWVQTTYEDKAELSQLLKGVDTVICFFWDAETSKRLIDAAVDAGVRRYVPSEFGTGVETEACLDVLSWYAPKIEVGHYLENLNKEKKVIEYTKFQYGGYTNYLGYPHQTSKYITTFPVQFNFEKMHALLVEGSLDDQITFTTVDDVVNVIAGALEYEGEWPVVGGIRGSNVTVKQILEMGGRIRGKPFEIEWLKKEDLEAGELKTDNYARLPFASVPKDALEPFSTLVHRGYLLSVGRGAWTVSDEWNKLLPDYEFTQVEDFLKTVWAGK
ncbi:Uu.00g018860.m01.CDS01 [Anthostomella pinea]|uniref:Uu.00g018860.m01.CDS01 n=1 Tax=Anthostomella pinea TaxID=933095 RepID=A0AAI8VZ69_9PEZI|nr:Uu.00g018860.m01.CDS01 [Anthostomella pinea]